MAFDWEVTQSRRLPIYLLVDTAQSMAGSNIVAANIGVTAIYQELMGDPRSANTVYMSLITFADRAYQLPFVPITHFTPPMLVASGRCSLGAALRILNDSLERDIIKSQSGRKFDYPPLVFLLTGGWATDRWEAERDRLRQQRLGNFIGLAIGDDARVGLIQQIAQVTLYMRDVTPDSIRQFFAWISASIKQTSRATAPRRRDIDYGK